MKQLDQLDPDTDYHIQFTKDSLMNIFKFCRDNNFQIQDYIKHKTGDIPTFVMHLRNREVSIYTLFGIDGFETYLRKVPNNRLDFTIGENFTFLLEKYRTRYYTCIKSKEITKLGIKKIEKLLTGVPVNRK